jgi:hypothetical protein
LLILFHICLASDQIKPTNSDLREPEVFFLARPPKLRNI